MSWPIGYWRSRVSFRSTLDGVIHADGVPVTETNGWIHLPLAQEYRVSEDEASFSLRVRLSVDAEGYPFLYAEDVEVAGRRYSGLYAAAVARGDAWLTMPVAAVRRAIEARIAARRPSHDSDFRRQGAMQSGMRLRPAAATGSRDADETLVGFPVRAARR
jgi:hypothetical protein